MQKKKNVRLYQVAKFAGISESRFSIRMRDELTNNQTLQLKNIIDSLSIGKTPEVVNVFNIKQNILTDEENEKRFRYYREGKSDLEMSSLCKVSISAIVDWRLNRGLMPNKRLNQRRKYNNFNNYFDDSETSKNFLEC